MSHQLKLNCPICNYARLANLSNHLTKVHGINGRVRFSVLSRQSEQPHSQTDSLPTQCGYTVPETSSLPVQRQPPNPKSDENEDNEDELIPCLYDSHTSYERVWGTNVPVMDHDIFKLHHPFSMVVAGPQGAGKNEFVKQLLFLKCYIMTDPLETIVWFYGRHQPDLFSSLTQEIPSIEFYEGLPTNIEVMFVHVFMIVIPVMREFGAPMFLLWTTIFSNYIIPLVW